MKTKYDKQKAKYEQKLQTAVDEALETQEIPDCVVGLAPDGDRTVLWRWMGPVYEDTAQDKLNQSIARGQKAIGKLALGSQIYDSAKTTGKKIDEAAEWAADTEGIDAVYEPGLGGVE